MKYSKVLEILYGSNVDSILVLLNAAVYAPQHKLPPKAIDVVHTGFCFKIHTGKRMEVLYNVETESLIRQNRLESYSTPLLNGLFLAKGDSEFFNAYLPLLYVGVAANNNGSGYFVEPEMIMQYSNRYDIASIRGKQKNDIDFQEITAFQVFDPNNPETKVIEYPFQRVLEETLFFGNNRFSVFQPYYDPREEEREFFENYDPDEERGTLEDWLEDEFGDDAGSAAWNID